MTRVRLAAAIVLLAPICLARNVDGTLGLIVAPNNGVPVIITAGGAFEVTATDECALTIDGTIPVAAEWVELPGGMHRARCVAPPDLAVGLHSLDGRTESAMDTNVRSVFVVSEFPTTYVVAHLTDTHIGKNVKGTPPPVALEALVQMLNGSGAAFVLITGDVTDNGAPEQFQEFLRLIDMCVLPTFVCTGNHDRNALNYERYLGPLNYSFRYGADGYLAIDTKDYFTADDMGDQPAESFRLRQGLDDVRWTVAFSHRYEPDMGMHTQLALFVDDPVDLYLFGHWHRANTNQEKTVPWAGWSKATRITVTPAAFQGHYRYLDVGPVGVKPRLPERLDLADPAGAKPAR